MNIHSHSSSLLQTYQPPMTEMKQSKNINKTKHFLNFLSDSSCQKTLKTVKDHTNTHKTQNIYSHKILSDLICKSNSELKQKNENTENSRNKPCIVSFSDYEKTNLRPRNFNRNINQSINRSVNISKNSSDSITRSVLRDNYPPICLNNLSYKFQNFEESKFSQKTFGCIKAFAANTHHGVIRDYNEDRVSIIMNVVQPSTFKGESWPRCSFFAVYDGHGGSKCADYLRDHLHNFIVKDQFFPSDPEKAIENGFEKAERLFIKNHAHDKNGDLMDKSGSCAIVCLVVNDDIYVANVGDSRAIMSLNKGKEIIALSKDHKPSTQEEKKRIIENGGRIYQIRTQSKTPCFPSISQDTCKRKNTETNIIYGPYRVFPGRLSVSRTFGDIEAKLPKYGGMANVIICKPEITKYKLKKEIDFIVLGCDGIYDVLSNEEISQCVWLPTQQTHKSLNLHFQAKIAVDLITKSALIRKAIDNITSVLLVFEGFEKVFLKNSKPIKEIDKNLTSPRVQLKEKDKTKLRLNKRIVSEGEDIYSLINNNRDNIKPNEIKENLSYNQTQSKTFIKDIDVEESFEYFRQDQFIFPETSKNSFSQIIDFSRIEEEKPITVIPHINTGTILQNILNTNMIRLKKKGSKTSPVKDKQFVLGMMNESQNNLFKRKNSRHLSNPCGDEKSVLKLKDNIYNDRNKCSMEAVKLQNKSIQLNEKSVNIE